MDQVQSSKPRYRLATDVWSRRTSWAMCGRAPREDKGRTWGVVMDFRPAMASDPRRGERVEATGLARVNWSISSEDGGEMGWEVTGSMVEEWRRWTRKCRGEKNEMRI